MSRGRIFAIAACALIVWPIQGSAQGRSSQSGVYTEAQATRGKDTYLGMCQACHTPASHTGPVFQNAWTGKTLWELFRYISENMPKMDPGSLSTEEYTQVTAYLLKLNGMPAGSDQLNPDSTALKSIRFDTVAARSKTPDR